MAESEILRGGDWEPRRFRAEGAVHVEILGARGIACRLEAEGLEGQLRRQGPDAGAFALSGAQAGVTLSAVTEGDGAFPGGATVELAVTFPGARRDYVVERLDISGHERAPLVRIAREGDLWSLSPALESAAPPMGAGGRGLSDRSGMPVPGDPSRGGEADGSGAADLLGSWLVRRLGDRGRTVALAADRILIDRSASMSPLAERAETLRDLVLALARAAGAPVPESGDAPVAGEARRGVGSVVGGPALSEGGGRTILITDLPVREEGAASLLIGDPRLLDVLSAQDAHVVGEDAWSELEREDSRFDDTTLRRLEPLISWLTAPVDREVTPR